MTHQFFHKTQFLLATCGCVMATASLLFAGPPKRQASDEKAVARVRAHVGTVDRQMKTARKVERGVEGLSTEGSNITGYFIGSDLVKIEARYFGESGKATEEFYLRHGQIFFGVRTDYDYTELLSGKVASTEQTRFYWNAKQLVRVMDGGKRLVLDAPETVRRAKEFAEPVPKFVALLRDPKGMPSDNR